MIPNHLDDIFIKIKHKDFHKIGEYWELEDVPFRVKTVNRFSDALYEYDLKLSKKAYNKLDDIEKKTYDPKKRINEVYTEAAHFAYRENPVLRRVAITPKLDAGIQEFIDILDCYPSCKVLKKLSNERRINMLTKYVELLNNEDY